MKMEVLGVQNVDYVSKRTGEPVKGRTFHCSFPDAQVKGLATDQIFVSDRLALPDLYAITPGMKIDVEYSRRGSVCNVAILK